MWILTGDSAGCPNADFQRVEQPPAATGFVAIVCGWTCVTYNGVAGVNLQMTLLQDSPGVYHVAQQQSAMIPDPNCGG